MLQWYVFRDNKNTLSLGQTAHFPPVEYCILDAYDTQRAWDKLHQHIHDRYKLNPLNKIDPKHYFQLMSVNEHLSMGTSRVRGCRQVFRPDDPTRWCWLEGDQDLPEGYVYAAPFLQRPYQTLEAFLASGQVRLVGYKGNRDTEMILKEEKTWREGTPIYSIAALYESAPICVATARTA